MNDLLLIIQREYLSRVRRKSFLLMTILTPLFLIAASIIFSAMTEDAVGGNESVLLFGDHNGYYTSILQRNSRFSFTEATEEYLEQTDPSTDFSAMLYLPDALDETPNLAFIVANYEISEALSNHINERLSEAATFEKWRKDAPTLSNFWENNRVEVHCQKMNNITGGNSSNEGAALIAIVASLLLYIFIFSYGSQVMRGVNEEKNNKIMEVMFLSTRPSHFMAGKIISVALVGLTQFAIWASAAFLLFREISDKELSILILFNKIVLPNEINIYSLAIYFVIFFLAGYLLYASLFASIGALSDPSTDTQQFFLPVTIPILFSIYAGIYTACHPDSTLGAWCSYIPFTSPIVMPTRICHGIDAWEIIGSLSILIVTDLLFFRLAGKIYRSAILLHGKKITYKDLWQFCKSND